MAQATIRTTIDRSQLAITTDAGEIVVTLGNLSDNIIEQLAMHGLKQKICDAAAIPRDTETGRSATPQEKFAAMRRVADSLLAGEWGVKRGDGDGSSGQSLLFRALQRLYPTMAPDAVRAKIAAWDKKQQAAMRKHPKIAAIILEIQAESAASGDIDTDAMLAELAD
jgi:hypothetical protein